MRKTIEDIKNQMLIARDKSGLSVITDIENLVKRNNATINQAITHLLKDKKMSSYKKNILNLLRISYPYDGEFEYAQVKNEKFVSSLEILKHEVESAPNVVLDEVYTSMKDRPEHHEDNEDHGIGVQQTAVYSVYQNTPNVIQDKPKIPKKIQKIEKKQKDIEDTNS